MKLIHQNITSTIEKAQNILLLGHRRPDGDALGCLAALAGYLKKLDKKLVLFSADGVPAFYQFLPHLENVTSDWNKINETQLDLAIALDTSDWPQSGIPGEREKFKSTLINIDHHFTNTHYGQINLVEPAASSTAEVLYNYFRGQKIVIDKKMATGLLSGITTDTNNFTNPATTFSSLRASSELLKNGARLQEIIDNTVKNKTLDILKMWGKILSQLEHNHEQGVTTAIISREDFIRHNLKEEMIDGVANFLTSLRETKIVLVLQELEAGEVKASLRTNREDIDVSLLAKKFGGGGHQKAAGFRIKAKIEELKTTLLSV